MVKRIFTYLWLATMAIMAYFTCTPSVWSKSDAIKKCKLLYEDHHGELNAIADYLDSAEFRDSTFFIHIRPDGVIMSNLDDTTLVKENLLPDRIIRICRELNIAEFKNSPDDNYFRLITGAFSNSDFDIDICLLKKGEKDFKIPDEDGLIKNRDDGGNFNYILGPYKNVLFYSKAN